MNLFEAVAGMFSRHPQVAPIPAVPLPVASPVPALWSVAEISPDRLQDVKSDALRIVRNRERYEAVGLGVPWWVIGLIHQRESSGHFGRHLHNGDPLTAKTVNVPAGRPKNWDPATMGWEDSAADALIISGIANHTDWSIAMMLDRMERYNGRGYRSHGIPSPYLWGATTVQQPGKYVMDGVFDPSVMDRQVGCVAVMKWLQAGGHIAI